MSTSDLARPQERAKKKTTGGWRRAEQRHEGGEEASSHLGMLTSLFRGRRATLLKAILTPTATTSVKEMTPPIT